MKIKDVKIGCKFKFGKIEFVKLDNTHSGCLCLATDILFKNRFDEDSKNNWEISTLRQEPLQVIECEKYEVIPETVGQFTGLCDKNGRKIFEGDIVESPNGTQGFIEWQNAECAFLVDIGDDWQTMDDCPYEVIGNKYDNKEEE